MKPIFRLLCSLLALALLTAGAARSGLATEPVRIDILIVYTPAVTDFYGGKDGVLAHVLATFEGSNAALERSEIPLIFNLAGLEEVAYEETASNNDMSVDLENLRTPGNGFLDEVHGLREAYGADLVSLFRNGSPAGMMGLAYVASTSPNWGYSVVVARGALSVFAFAHEVGHNLSAKHHRQAPGNEADIAFGHVFDGNDGRTYQTIMAQSGATIIPYFSNPAVSFAGTPTGVPQGDPWAADVATTFRTFSPTIAGFKPEQPALPQILRQPASTTMVSGSGAVLSPLINGLPPLQCQWYEGVTGDRSRPVAGANEPSLNLAVTSATTRYWLAVENGEGLVESAEARVVVAPHPPGPFPLLIEQGVANALPMVSTPLWQEFTVARGFVERIELELFKAGNPPPALLELSDFSGAVISRKLVTPAELGSGVVTTISFPVAAFVVPWKTYRVTLTPLPGWDHQNAMALRVATNLSATTPGVGSSSLGETSRFLFRVYGSDGVTYHTWLQSEGIDPAAADVTADMQGDGHSNLIRYAVGSSASSPASWAVPPPGPIETVDGTKVFPFRFNERKAMGDVTLVVESSTDLIHWHPVDRAEWVSEGELIGREAFEVHFPVEQDNARFIRLNASYLSID